MDKVIENWDKILQTVKADYDVGDVAFNTWLKPLKVYDVKDNVITILVPSEQVVLINLLNKKYKLLLQVTICEITGMDECEVKFISPDEAPKKKFLLILMLQQKQVLPILTVAVKKLTSIPNIFLIPLSSVTIINLHRPQPLQLLNLREIHTTRCLSMEVPALVKPILCIPSLIILLSTMKTAKFCMLPVKNLPMN